MMILNVYFKEFDSHITQAIADIEPNEILPFLDYDPKFGKPDLFSSGYDVRDDAREEVGRMFGIRLIEEGLYIIRCVHDDPEGAEASGEVLRLIVFDKETSAILIETTPLKPLEPSDLYRHIDGPSLFDPNLCIFTYEVKEDSRQSVSNLFGVPFIDGIYYIN